MDLLYRRIHHQIIISEKFKTYKNGVENNPINFGHDTKQEYNRPITLRELTEAISKAKDSATGPDEIHYQMLKHLPTTPLLTLLQIMNDIFSTGEFPPSWREATVIPIPKPGKDATLPESYRPIALTNTICKTMERIINTRLVWYLEKHNIITDQQAGFRKGRSTYDQLINFESKIRESSEDRRSQLKMLIINLYAVDCIHFFDWWFLY